MKIEKSHRTIRSNFNLNAFPEIARLAIYTSRKDFHIYRLYRGWNSEQRLHIGAEKNEKFEFHWKFWFFDLRSLELHFLKLFHYLFILEPAVNRQPGFRRRRLVEQDTLLDGAAEFQKNLEKNFETNPKLKIFIRIFCIFHEILNFLFFNWSQPKSWCISSILQRNELWTSRLRSHWNNENQDASICAARDVRYRA